MFPLEMVKTVKIEDVQYTVIRSCMPYLILAILKKENTSTPYQIMQKIQEKLNIIMSSGTIYGALYSMERKGYIEKDVATATFKITVKGNALLSQFTSKFKKTAEDIENFLKNL